MGNRFNQIKAWIVRLARRGPPFGRFTRRHWLWFVVLGGLILGWFLLVTVPNWDAESLREKCPTICDWDKEKDIAKLRNESRTTFAQILGGGFLFLSVVVAWRNVMQQREGQITSRFTDAIEQLGATHKDSDKPVIEVRMGGIFALEQIARDSPEKYHRQVFEVLTAYVRENAPATSEEEAEDDQSQTAQQRDTQRLREDIQAILTVIGRRVVRREDEPTRLNLSRTDLRRADLRSARLQNATLFDSQLDGANFRAAQLEHTWFWGAKLRQATFTDAELQGAVFWGTSLEGANFTNASLHRTNFGYSKLQDACFMRAYTKQALFTEAKLERATFEAASLEEAWFVGAHLQQADFSGANLRQANFARAKLELAVFAGSRLQAASFMFSERLRRSQLCGADIDHTTSLTDGLDGRTKHQVCVEKVPVPGLLDD